MRRRVVEGMMLMWWPSAPCLRIVLPLASGLVLPVWFRPTDPAAAALLRSPFVRAALVPGGGPAFSPRALLPSTLS